jgi:hypothetical protein
MRFFRLILGMMFAFVTLTTGAIMIGHAQPLPERIAMLHLNDCLPPCWAGITPGVTTLKEANTRIKQIFLNSQFRVISDSQSTGLRGTTIAYEIQNANNGQPIFTINLWEFNNVISGIDLVLEYNALNYDRIVTEQLNFTFGELNTVWGSPRFIGIDTCTGIWVPTYDMSNTYALINPPTDSFPKFDVTSRISWSSQVSNIRFYPETPQVDQTGDLKWRGFLSYRQYDPNRTFGICEGR